MGITNGRANFGGAISNSGWTELVLSVVTGNTANISGGGLHISGNRSTIVYENTRIFGNSGDDIFSLGATLSIRGTIYDLRELFESEGLKPLYWQDGNGARFDIPLTINSVISLTLVYEEISEPKPEPTPDPTPTPNPEPEPSPDPTPTPPEETPETQPPNDNNNGNNNSHYDGGSNSSSEENWYVSTTAPQTERIQQVVVEPISLTSGRFSVEISSEQLRSWGIRANSSINHTFDPTVIDGRHFWLDRPHSFGLWLGDDEIDFDNTPITITVDLYGLNLNCAQLDRLVAFVFDEESMRYSHILGELSEDNRVFTFEVSSNGIYGIMLMPHITIRLAIDNHQYIVNGVTYTNDVAPFIDSDSQRTLVPIRVIAESLGANVDWINDTRTVIIEKGDVILTMPIGQPLPDGLGVPLILNDRTFVPVRFVSEMLGADIHWDNHNRAIYIWR